MRLAYQVATPEVKRSWGVTAYQAALGDSYKAVCEAGYDGVELMVAVPADVDADLVNTLSEVYGLPVAAVCTGEIFGQEGLSFTHPDVQKREAAIRSVCDAVDLACKVNTGIVNIGRVRGGISQDGDHGAERKLSLDGIAEVSAYAHKKNIVIALEPVNSIAATFINTTKEGVDVVRQLGEPALKLMLDSNHMYIDDVDIVQSMELAADLLVYVHLVDSNRLYPGNCKFDFPRFLRKLATLGYDGWLTVEVFQRPDQDTALRKSIEYLKPILASAQIAR